MARVGVVLAALLGLGLGYYYIVLDWEGRPICRKQINLGIRMWVQDTDEVDALARELKSIRDDRTNRARHTGSVTIIVVPRPSRERT